MSKTTAKPRQSGTAKPADDPLLLKNGVPGSPLNTILPDLLCLPLAPLTPQCSDMQVQRKPWGCIQSLSMHANLVGSLTAQMLSLNSIHCTFCRKGSQLLTPEAAEAL